MSVVSGGARNRSGPPPDPGAIRRLRKDDGQWVTLPSEGRQTPPPDWPLTKATVRERHWWAQVWALPQAVQWERAGQVVEVALYVRRLTKAERPSAPTNLVTQVRQLADALGLTMPGMRALRWQIATNEVADRRAEQDQAEAPPSARSLFAVPDDATG